MEDEILRLERKKNNQEDGRCDSIKPQRGKVPVEDNKNNVRNKKDRSFSLEKETRR